MIESVCVYIGALIISLMSVNHAQKQKDIKIYLIAPLILSLVAGLRANTVGIDTATYYRDFDLLLNGYDRYVYGLEAFFVSFSSFFLKISKSIQLLFLFYSLITNLFIFLRLWDFRDILDFKYCLLCYYSTFYFMSYNIMRQFIAVAIVFWATRFLQKDNITLYCLLVFFSALFHKSALIGFMAILIRGLDWNNISSKLKKLIIAIMIFSPVLIKWLTMEIQKYERYFYDVSYNIGAMMAFKMIFFGICVLSIKKDDNYTDVRAIELLYMAGLVLNTFGYFFQYLDRIGIYFYIYEVAFIGIVVNKCKNSTIIRLIAFSISAYYLFGSFVGNGQGQLPYLFYWQI